MTLINSEYGKRGGSEMLQVIKRDGTKVPFDKHKIAVAIEKAEHSSTGLYESGLADKIYVCKSKMRFIFFPILIFISPLTSI